MMRPGSPGTQQSDRPLLRPHRTQCPTSLRWQGYTTGIAIADTDENDALNGMYHCKGDCPMKRGGKIMSPSQGLGGICLLLLQLPMPPAPRPMQSTTAFILPAVRSNESADIDALAVGETPNGSEETPNGNGTLADCRTQSMHK